MTNATFYTFKPTSSSKWAYSGRGVVDDHAFSKIHDAGERRRYLVHLNGGRCPGMGGAGDAYDMVVIPDDTAPGWPLLFKTDRKWE